MSKDEWQVKNVLSVELVAAYVRVSTTEQKLHGLSLDAQRAKLAKFASENNMKIVEWYMDEGVSGRKLIRKRPELQRMIQDAEQGKFERIIFIKLDRFFRSVAEYHECMKRIAPVVWTTTDEEYDLTTANGRMLVNFKLTIAEMEADQGGERVDIINEYKVSTGQPISGSQPFGWRIATDPNTGRKKIVKDEDCSDVLDDIIQHFLIHQSKHKTTVFTNAKHHTGMNYRTLSKLLRNTYLYGSYRGNPNYCEPYIDKETFDRIQEILDRNIKTGAANRAYYFSGLIRCPECGTILKGAVYTQRRKSGDFIYYKKYKCSHNALDAQCSFIKTISENVMERKLLAEIEQYLENAKVTATDITDGETVAIPRYDVDDLHDQIDRLNYSWQTGKIRKVEQYEQQFAELMAKLEEAEAEQKKVIVKDFSKIDAILHTGWKEIYKSLDDEHKRAFWRSFIARIDIHWTTEDKRITDVKFF